MTLLAPPRDRVDQLLRLLRWRSRTASTVQGLLLSALLCATIWAALWFVPVVPAWIGRLVLGIPILMAALAWWQHGPGDAVEVADRRLRLGDALRTLLGGRRADAWQGCLRGQLELDLRGQDLRRGVPRLALGRARQLLFPLLLLLFLRFGLPDFLGSRGPAGIGGQSQGGTDAGSGGGPGAAGGQGGTSAEQRNPPPPEGGGRGGRPPKASTDDEHGRRPPGPLPEAERHVDAFVPPAFDRDGPRTEREIEAVERPIGAIPPARSDVSTGGGTTPDSPLPDLRPAVEAAIARRKVDPAEAGFMRRYFERLRQERR